MFASVDRAAFCLLTGEARIAAVKGAFDPIDRRLRAAGVDDLQFVVVGLTTTGAALEQALALGQRARVRLTPRGRAC